MINKNIKYGWRCSHETCRIDENGDTNYDKCLSCNKEFFNTKLDAARDAIVAHQDHSTDVYVVSFTGDDTAYGYVGMAQGINFNG